MSVFNVFNKKIIFIFALLLGFMGIIGVSHAQVNLNPIYTSDRFQPSDAFHAGCDNHIDVVFDLDTDILGVNAILKYNNADIDITKIVPQGEKKNNLTYVIQGDKIILNKLKTKELTLDKVVFSVFFKGKDDLESTEFSFITGSYVLDANGDMIDIDSSYKFTFSKVPECDPDIISPSVEMIFPTVGTGKYVALDSYFQFKIVDQGKGINKNSINISIDDIKYDLSNIEHGWSGDVLTIYPDTWLPIGEKILLSIDVQDKQVYGKANETIKEYDLQTSTGLYLLNDIDPIQFRKLVNKAKYYQGSAGECNLLSDIYLNGDDNTRGLILSINKRLNCSEINLSKLDDLAAIGGTDEEQNKTGFSVFAILGWVLFGLLLFINVFSYVARAPKE